MYHQTSTNLFFSSAGSPPRCGSRKTTTDLEGLPQLMLIERQCDPHPATRRRSCASLLPRSSFLSRFQGTVSVRFSRAPPSPPPQVTSFSNSEEKSMGFTDVVPFLLEDALKERGAIYQKGPDWVRYGHLASMCMLTSLAGLSIIRVLNEVSLRLLFAWLRRASVHCG
jgi:hypothetical protein